jgi:hypothetical protein
MNLLKSGLNRQQNIFQSLSKANETAMKASYALSYLIASNSNPFTDGHFVEECLIETVKVVCPDKVKYFQNINLTRNTVAERIGDKAYHLRIQSYNIYKHVEAFSIAADESADVGTTSSDHPKLLLDVCYC